MALFQTKPKPIAPAVTKSNEVAAKIQQRRYQILVHSLIYYELDMSLVPDDKWAKWALELVDLQKANPDIAKTVIFADAFKDFDGSTGFDLPYRDAQIVHIARKLLRESNESGSKQALLNLANVRTLQAEYKGRSYSVPEKTPAIKRKAVKKNEAPNRKKLF